MVARYFFILLVTFFSPALLATTPIASIDRSVIAIDDTFTLKIKVNDSGTFSGPDLNPLRSQFQVLANNQSSQHIIRNGVSESWTEWTITLAPKIKGQLTIPPISVAGEKTQPLSVIVQPSIPRSVDNPDPVFLESEISDDEIYIQQQLIYTLRIYQSVQLDNMNVSEPEFDNALIEKLSQNSFQRRIGNTPFRVHELRYAIFPQQTGELVIPEMVFTASEVTSRRSAFSLPGSGRLIRKLTQQHSVNVNAPPVNLNGKPWLPARAIKLSESWSGAIDEIRVGDSITRSITLNAEGLSETQLPPYTFAAIDGFKLYPDQGQSKTSVTEHTVTAFRTDSAAIIPTQVGVIELPEIKVAWWDTQKQALQEATLPAKTINVLPALDASTTESTPLAVDHSGTNNLAQGNNVTQPASLFWPTTSAVFALLWLITLWLWWQSRQKKGSIVTEAAMAATPKQNEKQAFEQLTKACRGSDLIAIRTAIILWADSFWENDSTRSLHDIQQCSDHASFNTALAQLDGLIYGNNKTNWNRDGFISLVKLIREQKTNKDDSKKSLPPLYATG